MDTSPPPKSTTISNILVRLLSFCVLVLVARFAFFITANRRGCDSLDICFSPTTTDSNLRATYYSSVFQDLIADGFLSPNSNSLCVETLGGEEVRALKDLGVYSSIGISKNKVSSDSIRYAEAFDQPFENLTFDFVFSGTSGLDRTIKPVLFVVEVSRTLRPGGFFVVHTESAKDKYSLHSLLRLFENEAFTLVKLREIDGLDSSLIREIIFRKDNKMIRKANDTKRDGKNGANKCSFLRFKHELIRKAEPLIKYEPSKKWITFKRNVKSVKYLSSMVDISFKNRYLYIDVGARSYASSVGSWFKKHYPNQGKKFETYAVGADNAFHDEYKRKIGITLLPYAAWVRNETLFFEIRREPSRRDEERGRVMGRVNQAVQSSINFMGDMNKIRGFDFAMWLKGTVGERDYVVVKMDVEGAEFDLIPRLVETGAICLIDEIFLQCHYNRWQRCCPGVRSLKYQKTYAQCLEMFLSLRRSGVLVHQWW